MDRHEEMVADLAKLGSETLADFIADLYGLDAQMDRRIERLLLSRDADALAAALKKQITSLKRRRSFVSYYEAAGFANEIGQIVDDLEHQVLPAAPENAFTLINALLATVSNSLDRCDDSDGSVGDVYRQACLLWLKAASACPPQKEPWLERVKRLAASNDYGVLDPLLPNAGLLLTADELRQLAFYYETGLRKALAEDKNGHGYLSWKVNLCGVAEALKDPELYARATSLVSPSLNDLQKKDLARFCIRCGAYEAALKWLKGDWSSTAFENRNIERLSLLAECYRGLEQPEKEMEVLISRLQLSPTFEHLQEVVSRVPPEQAETLRRQAIDLAMGRHNTDAKLELLLKLGEVAAAEQVAVAEKARLGECYYGHLTYLLQLAPEEAVILRIVLLRCLLDDILARAKTQAYRYGAGYLKQLAKLDRQGPDYGELPSHALYMDRLRERHGRKRAFWRLVDQASVGAP